MKSWRRQAIFHGRHCFCPTPTRGGGVATEAGTHSTPRPRYLPNIQPRTMHPIGKGSPLTAEEMYLSRPPVRANFDHLRGRGGGGLRGVGGWSGTPTPAPTPAGAELLLSGPRGARLGWSAAREVWVRPITEKAMRTGSGQAPPYSQRLCAALRHTPNSVNETSTGSIPALTTPRPHRTNARATQEDTNPFTSPPPTVSNRRSSSALPQPFPIPHLQPSPKCFQTPIFTNPPPTVDNLQSSPALPQPFPIPHLQLPCQTVSNLPSSPTLPQRLTTCNLHQPSPSRFQSGLHPSLNRFPPPISTNPPQTAGRSLMEKRKRKKVPLHSFPKKARRHTMCWRWAVGDWQLATGGWWQLVAVGGGRWRLVVGD